MKNKQIDKLFELINDNDKDGILKFVKDEKLEIQENLLKTIQGFNYEYAKVEIIKSLPEEKVGQYIHQLEYDEDKVEIIKDLKKDKIKNELLSQIEDEEYKAEIITSLKEDELKVSSKIEEEEE